MKNYKLGLLLCSLVVVLLAATLAKACPNCQETLARDPAQQGLAKGIYYSILFMMSMPFAILGTFGGLAYLSIRRARTRAAHDAGQD